jgi:pantoate--beta-alanine ligase
MQFVKTISTVKKILGRHKKKGEIIGFVPTLGYLHEGHLSLVRIARKKSQFVIVSIFVNPTQFGPHEDFRTYPRNLKRDMQLLKKEGVAVVFTPTIEEIYPDGYKTYVEVCDVSTVLCGVSRPTHFRGVTTIVLKLFNIVRPDIAVFGKKDYQQAVIIRQMVKDLNIDIKIVLGKIIREKDGLAMSSRNAYLSRAERKNAVILYQSLKWVKNAYKKGLRNPTKAIQRIKAMIRKRGGRIDYVEVVDKNTLRPVRSLTAGTVVCLAVYFGTTRLIDNMSM